MTTPVDPPAQLRIRVKPGSRKGPLIETDAEGTLVVFVRERAVDGAANTAVEKALAAHFADHDTIGTQPQGRTDQIGHGDDARPGSQRYGIGSGALQLAARAFEGAND